MNVRNLKLDPDRVKKVKRCVLYIFMWAKMASFWKFMKEDKRRFPTSNMAYIFKWKLCKKHPSLYNVQLQVMVEMLLWYKTAKNAGRQDVSFFCSEFFTSVSSAVGRIFHWCKFTSSFHLRKSNQPTDQSYIHRHHHHRLSLSLCAKLN